MTKRKYGSAILTAFEAQYKSIEEIELLYIHRSIRALFEGGSPLEWEDCFWGNMAGLMAAKSQRQQ